MSEAVNRNLYASLTTLEDVAREARLKITRITKYENPNRQKMIYADVQKLIAMVKELPAAIRKDKSEK